jgi:hypothetical protein
MIINAWYSALGLQLEDCPGLVHFPENGKYILEKINQVLFLIIMTY